jgi:uncharacterized integral membrane protein
MTPNSTDLEKLTAAAESATAEPRAGRPVAKRRDRGRMIAAGILAALIVVFALVNLGNVRVHWVVTTARTPLILVIALAFLLGVIVDRLAARARRRRRA